MAWPASSGSAREGICGNMRTPYYLSVLITAVVLCFPSTFVAGEDVKLKLRDEVIDGPASGSNRAAWLGEMIRWRDAERKRIKYDPAEYARPELQWTQRNFVQPQMMVEDRYFYDPKTGEYTVDRYLDDLGNATAGSTRC